MLALKTVRPALRASLSKRYGGVSMYDNIQSGHNETYSRDPSTGIAFNSFGFAQCLNDADIQKHQPNQHHKIHMTIAKHHDGVGISYTGTYAWTTNAFTGMCVVIGISAAVFGMKSSLEGALKLSPSLSWIECFKITGTFKSGGYPGFTAWTGSTGKEADSVSLISMSMYNYDTTSIGEDLSMDVSKEIQEAYREMLTDEKRHFKDQKSQKEHLQRLTNMLSNHMQQVKPQEQEMFTKLGNLQDKMHKLEEGCKTLRQEIRVVLGNGSSTAVSSMKTELIGLRHIFMKDSQAHSQKIDSVRETVGTVKKADDKKVDPNALLLITEKTDKLEKTIQASSSQVSWMMIFLIVAVLGIGVLMYNRMRYYEKKHFI